MSATVDERVVSMRFDNSHFEKNVSNTMSTLDKLKEKLGFKGATKGLEDLSSAAKKVDLSDMGRSCDAVSLKFNAMYTIADQAFRNITNAAMNAAKNFVNALAIAPVKDGFQEYEMTLNAIQTTMAGTGKTAKEVEAELKKLDEYADKTVYSTSDMLNNLPKFTNAGVELEDATKAMIGIANATALAGGDAGKASIAFYNLGQAIGTGYLTRMDYNSINSAGIATMEWKEQMVEAAIAAGTLEKAEDGLYKAGNKTFTMQQLFIEGLQHQWATTDVMMKVFGDYGNETTEIGKKAYSAAQDIKTFTMMMDSLKATAGTGWKDTWQIIFGDLDEAKVMWTGLTNFLSNIITKMADFRNAILESALGKGLSHFFAGIDQAMSNVSDMIGKVKDGVSKVTDPVKSTIESIAGITRTLAEHNAVVNEVIRGLWGNSHERWNALTEAGYDWVYVQNKVNEKLGNSYRRTSDYTRALENQGDATEEVTKTQTKLAKSDGELLASLCKLSDEQLLQAGYTKEQIESLRELQRIADKLGLSIEDLVAHMDEIDGRWLFLNAFKNLGNTLTGVGIAIKEAWKGIFPEATMDSMATAIFNAIAAFHRFTASLKLVTTVVDENGKEIQVLNGNGEKLARTFKGIFAALDIVLTVVGGPLKIAFKLLTQFLDSLGFNILDVTAFIGDMLVKVRDFIDGALDFTSIFEKISAPIKKAIETFKGWIASLKESENLPQDIAKGIASGFGKVFRAIRDFFKNLPEFFRNGFSGLSDSPIAQFISKITGGLKVAGQTIVELGKILLEKLNGFLSARGFKTISEDSIAGLVNGLKEGASKVWNAAVEMAKSLVQKVKDFLGIHSPSTVFAAIGGFIVAGLIAGLQNGIPDSLGAIKDVFQPMLDWIKNLDFGAILSAVVSLGMVRAFNKIGDGFAAFGGIGEAFGEVLENTAVMIKSFSKVLKSVAFENISNGIKNFAIALAILVGALVVLAYVCGQENMNVWEAVAVIGALAIVLGILAAATSAISKSSVAIGKEGLQMKSLTSGLLGIGAALVLMALTVKMVGSMDPESAKAGFDGLLKLVLAIVGILAACKLLVTGDLTGNIDRVGKTMVKLSVAMLLLVIVAKLISGMEWNEMGKAAIGFSGLIGIITLLMLATKLVGPNADKIGGTILKVSIAMAALVIVAKMIAGMSWDEMGKAAVGLGGLVAIVSMLMLATRLVGKGKNVSAIGGAILGIAAAMVLLTLVIKMVSSMDAQSLIKGVAVIAAFGLIISALIASTKKAGKHAVKAAATIFAVAMAVGILAIVATLLGMVDLKHLAQGIIAVGLLSSMVAGMVAVCRGVKDIKSTLIVLVVAVAVLAAAVVGLSFIDPGKLATATGALSALIGMFSILVASTKYAKNVKVGTLAALVGVVALLALIVAGLSFIKADASLLASVAGVSVLLLALSATLYALSGLDMRKLSSSKMTKLLVAMAGLSAVLALLGLVLAMMSALDVTNAIPNAIALSILVVALSGALYLLKGIGQFAIKALLGVVALAAMAVPLYLFVKVLASMQNVQNALANTIVLTLLASAMTLLLMPLMLVGALIGPALLGVLALTAMAVPLIAFVKVLGLMQNVQNALSNTTILIALATALTLLLVPLLLVGALIYPAILGVIALTAMAVPLLAFVGVLAVMQNIQNAEANTMLLIKLMSAMTQVLLTIAPLSPLAILGVTALTAMLTLMVTLGLVATAIGALVTKFPQLQTFLDTGIPILEQLAAGLGSILGSFIAGFTGAVMTILPQLGTCLSEFMTNATPFIEGAKTVNGDVLKGVGILAGAVIALTAADLLAGVTSFLQGGSSFADLGTQLSQFMINALPFITTAATITPDMLSGVRAIADTILILTAANVLEGLTSWLTGGSSLENFAAQLPILGRGLASFATNLGAFTEEQLTTVNCAAQAIKTLAQASGEIPNTGGLLGMLVGENDLGIFAAQFPSLGTGLAQFLSNVGTFTDQQVATVTCAAEAIKELATAASEIPNAGGWVGAIVGENDLETFAAQFPSLGTGLAGFLANVGTFTDEQVATVTCAANAIKTLASAASEIPNAGGWVGAIVGENDLGAFASQFPLVGSGLAGFLTNVGTFTEEQTTTVSCAANAVKALAIAASNIPNSGGWISKLVGENDLGTFATQFPNIGKGIKGFVTELGTFSQDQVSTVTAGVSALNAIANISESNILSRISDLMDLGDYLPDFASSIASFCEDMPSDELATSAVRNLNKILNTVNQMGNVDYAPLATFTENLGNAGSAGVDKFVSAFTSDATKADLDAAAKAMGDKVVDGLESKEDKVEKAGTKIAKKAVDGAETQDDEMESAGKDLGSGLVKGINAKKQAAYDAGYALGQMAVQGEKDGQASKSPSKLTIQAGKWLGDGLIIGIKQMGDKVYGAGRNLGKTATTSISSAISKVADMVNSDIDAQPSIRPVLDLSDVKSGIGTIGSMFGSGASIGVMANVGAISTAMNSRGQNGGNSEVVSAIDKLRKDVGKLENRSYSIGDITYSSGDEVASAIETLVRAVRVEGRA